MNARLPLGFHCVLVAWRLQGLRSTQGANLLRTHAKEMNNLTLNYWQIIIVVGGKK